MHQGLGGHRLCWPTRWDIVIFSLPSFLLYFFPTPSYVWPLKRCRVEGGFCWGLIINWPEVTSYHQGAMAYYSSIWDQWRPVSGQLWADWWWRKAAQQRGNGELHVINSKCFESDQYNKHVAVLCFETCARYWNSSLSMSLKRRFHYKD